MAVEGSSSISSECRITALLIYGNRTCVGTRLHDDHLLLRLRVLECLQVSQHARSVRMASRLCISLIIIIIMMNSWRG